MKQILGLAGEFSRLTFSPAGVRHVAVVVKRNLAYCTTHAGIAHRSAGRLEVLHLASHEFLCNEADDGSWIFAIPRLQYEEDGEYLAGFCRRIHRSNGRGNIPYSFEWQADASFDRDSGRFVAPIGTEGLTCSTFVATVFRAAGRPLLVLDSWPADATREDIEAREWGLRMWRASGRASLAAQAGAIEPSILARRVNPEQVAGACLQRRLPARYRQCCANAAVVLARLDEKFGPPTRPLTDVP